MIPLKISLTKTHYTRNRYFGHCVHPFFRPYSPSDGIKAFRKSINGQDLPNARLVASYLLPDVEEVNQELTQMVMQWGQSMVHDQTRTPQVLANAPLCCPPNSSTHPECSRIEPLPAGDSLTRIFNQTCLRQVRSASCADCNLGPRDSLNAATVGAFEYLSNAQAAEIATNTAFVFR